MTDFTMIKKLFHITKRNGFSHDEIQTIKNNFGELPQVFIDYYLELGKDERLNHTQDSLIKPEQFQYFKHSEYLIFYCENQRACVWGIHRNDLSRSNPPVYMSYDEKVWKMEFETLTDFFRRWPICKPYSLLNTAVYRSIPLNKPTWILFVKILKTKVFPFGIGLASNFMGITMTA